jgi:hypothetical protein
MSDLGQPPGIQMKIKHIPQLVSRTRARLPLFEVPGERETELRRCSLAARAFSRIFSEAAKEVPYHSKDSEQRQMTSYLHKAYI